MVTGSEGTLPGSLPAHCYFSPFFFLLSPFLPLLPSSSLPVFPSLLLASSVFSPSQLLAWHPGHEKHVYTISFWSLAFVQGGCLTHCPGGSPRDMSLTFCILKIQGPITSPTHPAPGPPGFEVVGTVHLSSERKNGHLQYSGKAGNGQSQGMGQCLPLETRGPLDSGKTV